MPKHEFCEAVSQARGQSVTAEELHKVILGFIENVVDGAREMPPGPLRQHFVDQWTRRFIKLGQERSSKWMEDVARAVVLEIEKRLVTFWQ